jgi:pyruvate dehydrogenase E1 component alpha subunit
LEDHTTSDDSTRYRDEEEIEEWKEHDPLERFREYLKEHDMWSSELESFEEEAENSVDKAAKKAMEIEDPSVEDMFDYVYGEMPDDLRKQKEEWVKRNE